MQCKFVVHVMVMAGVVVRLVGGCCSVTMPTTMYFVGGDVKFGAQSATMLVTARRSLQQQKHPSAIRGRASGWP